MSSSAILLEDFGQKVDLTRRIREVLLNYPEGTTVVKELVQNADDAGATKVCLCLDRRRHGSDSLLSDSLAQWQGPALLAFNDAVFTDDDFLSISRIGGSGKHAQAWKTGRFGVGFNSVYHLTDLPSFVSGKYVVLFDPQGIYLPKVSASNPGKRIDYVATSAMSVYGDQFSPYCAFGCDMTTPFGGTLFRFPLRNAEQAAGSKLSRQAYLEDDISSMFHQLYEEGVFTLLFLKNVLCIEMYVWESAETQPRKLYACSVSSADHDVILHRQAVLRLSKSLNSKDSQTTDCYSVSFSREAVTENRSETTTDSFFIVQTMASASSRIGSFAAKASKEYDIHLLPWASVATCTSENSLQNSTLKTGLAFCFLPLPLRTGLSVHVNGYFEVSSNRRGIWYGDDMDRSGKIRSVWNRLLLEDVVAPTFRQLLIGVQGLLDSKSLYYSLWPSGSFDEPWNILVEHLYKNISDAPVLHTDLEGGKWVSPIKAFLHDKEFAKSKELGEALLQLGMPIVHLSSTLSNMLLKFANTSQLQKVVTPDSVRHFLRDCNSLSALGKSYKLVLLDYCLEDLIDIDVGSHAGYLPLLPLANGDFGSFSEVSKGISYFICNELEYKLLQLLHDRVIDTDLPDNILIRLSSIAKSSATNLCIFDVCYLVQFFPRFLPPGWKFKSKVSWEPESSSNHPTEVWLVLFWQYLEKHCEKLSLFGDWPILPSITGHLYRISKQLKMLNAKRLSDKMQCILIKIGCKILNPSYRIEHPDLSHYVSDGDGSCIVESIYDVFTSNGSLISTVFDNFEAEERDELRRFLLDPKWYFGNSMNESDIRNCKRLCIYKVYSGGSSSDFYFSDLESTQKYLPPLDVPESFMGEEFIACSSDSEQEVLLRYYGIKRMGKTCFYKEHLLNRISELQPEVRDSIIVSILQTLPQLCIEDISFKDYLRGLEFVPTLSGILKRPSILYDPRNEELYALLANSECFPSGIFQESGILDMLQGLGLRTSVSPEAVVESARQVERLMRDDQQSAYLRGKVLLSYLEVNAMKWMLDPSDGEHGKMNKMFSRAVTVFRPGNLKSDLEKFWSDLQLISWCPVLVNAPFPALPWPVASSMVAPPKLVRMQTDLWLVSASMRILDVECSSTALSYSLGWSSPAGGSVIAAQLLELGKNNEIVNDQELRQELALAMPRIYSILTTLIDSDEMDIVKAVLEGCRWIWVGDGFATADEVVLDGQLHLAPYIRVIPIDLAVFKGLFIELGIREFLKPTDYSDILCRMAEKKGSTPLNAHELRASILIVQHLADVPLHEQKANIYLPDVSSRLFPASNLVYNDAPWLLGSEDSGSFFNVTSTATLNARKTIQKFVHGNISNDVAEKLGVCSLRRTLLAESADSMNMSLSGAAEAFGQHEALTTRLKHILEMYADGPGILYELVQNAEDAGASEVTFLLDKTQYGTSSLLSPEMADWQGPSLYCFNDSVFTPQDLYAISRIGQESKLEKPFAIGRFGLGFNCVYHFTDIPTFVSGENIVMFDPHASYLPGISPSHPGLRIKFVGRRILEQFPDQFSPFLHFGCDLQQPFPGTLFRFPLRSATAACRSQIKKEGYAPEDVASLFASFTQAVSNALLFLRNVKTVSVFVKEGAGQEMQLLHRAHKYSMSEPHVEANSVQSMFNFFDGSRHNGMDKEQFVQKLNKLIDRDLPHKSQKIVITEESSAGNLSHCWITSECLGSGQAKKKSARSNEKSDAFIPWACVAAHLNSVNVDGELGDILKMKDGHRIMSELFQVSTDPVPAVKDFEGRAFCFLPLPITTGLPAHINGYFELSSNRRDIWFGNDMAGGGKKRSDWNIYLLENVVAPAYAHMLEKIASETGPSDLFFTFWPKQRGSQPWESVVRKLYMFIADFGLCVLYTKARGGQWISTKQAIFPDFVFDKAQELIDVLSDAGLPLVTVSQPIVERFMDSCPSLHFLTPPLLRTLLIRRKRGFRDRNAMILILEYCLFDLKIPLEPSCLYGLPLLPLADGTFTTFGKSGTSERVYVGQGDEHGLLKVSVPNQLVDCDIPEGVYEKLCGMAKRGDSNISVLSSHLLEKLLLKLLPAEWQHTKQVTWVPGHQGQPSLEWLRLLWSYLNSSCADLSLFSKWPLLPVGNNCLMQLRESSNVIKDDGWSENMSSLLLKIGCLFLRHDLPVEHPQLDRFVQPPTASGVLNALLAISGKPENIEGVFHDASEGELHELRSFVLQSKWFLDGQLEEVHIAIIKHLPVFESYRSRKLVSLNNPCKWLKPYGVCEDFLDDDFIRTDSERENILLRRYLQIGEPSRVKFYKNHVLSCMSKFISQQEVISAILHDLKLLVEEDNSVTSTFSKVAFVLAGDGSWQQPSRLYDPRVRELQEVLHAKAFFPSQKFSDTEALETLSMLGLRRTLGFTGLLDCARSVSLFQVSMHSETLSHGRKLLLCLDALSLGLSNQEEGTCEESNSTNLVDSNGSEDVNATTPVGVLDITSSIGNFDDKPEEEFWSELREIAWCPISVDPPVKGFPWLKSSHQVAPPGIVRPMSHLWVVSHSMHILDGECRSMYLQQKLGWLDQLNMKVLSSQLIELSIFYIQLKSTSVERATVDDALQKGIPSLYLKLQEYVGTTEFMDLKSALNGVAWVWIGDDFVASSALAFDSPVKFSPYLYVVPSELSDFRDLLLELGVKLSFDIFDYLNVLYRLQNDVKGCSLSPDQLSFVHCVLEAVADCCIDIGKPLSEISTTPLLVPDFSGALMDVGHLVFNDAPWMESNTPVGKRFVHQSVSNDLANKLGVQSLRCLSLVDEEMTKDLPCMDYARIKELLGLHGENDLLLFDLLELADCCKAKKLHLIFDKRTHSRQSLLQQNLGEFQGPALVAILEGAILSREEVSSLQFRPPWRLRGNTLSYGLGLLSCYSVCELLSMVSGDVFYIFDPCGSVLAVPPSLSPAAKVFSLTGTNLIDRFRDQFSPMLLGESSLWSSSNSTIIRMPLSSDLLKDGIELGLGRIKQINDRFLEQGSRTLLFLKSVVQVSLLTWEEESTRPCEDYSLLVDSSSAIMRNPFSEKKWRKFQISRLFSSSNTAMKLHLIDVITKQGGDNFFDQWLVVLTLGSGQTRNMALDRRYLAYNLTPVAGVAAHISRNGHPADICLMSSLMSPLPLSSDIKLPVAVLGCFLVCHNGGRSLFKYQDQEVSAEAWSDASNQLVEAWNRELMSCVRDSYIELVIELQRLKRDHSSSAIDPNLGRAINLLLKAYGDQIYSFWPRSFRSDLISQPDDASNSGPRKVFKADWECLVEQVIKPFYARAVDLPLWQLYSGNLVKAEEGMFLSQPGNGVGGNLLPATVCGFVKEHYPVFTVPWELVTEIQALGIAVREVKPKMVRDLLRGTSTSVVLRSVDTYMDVLEYCLSDIHIGELSDSENKENRLVGNNSAPGSVPNIHNVPSSSTHNPASSGDAIEMMTSLGKALFDFGRGVVEDIGRSGGSSGQRQFDAGTSRYGNVDQKLVMAAIELKGLPFPTATNHLTKIGTTELWIGTQEQQKLMKPLAAKFMHPKVMDRSILADIFANSSLQTLLKLQKFTLHLLSIHMRLVFNEKWVSHVIASNVAPWFSWENTSGSGGEGGPSSEWIRLFWKNFNGSLEDLILFSDWPIIPAFLGRPILCRVRERNLIFVPPACTNLSSADDGSETDVAGSSTSGSDSVQAIVSAFEATKQTYPWLLPLLNQCNIPIFDIDYMDCAASCNSVPASGQSLGQVIASKLVAAKQAGYFPELTAFAVSDREELLTLFAEDFSSYGSNYSREELDVLRSLPIYKTVVGSYTRLHGNDLCMIASNSFLKPYDERCLFYASDSKEFPLLIALGVSLLRDQNILLRFGLPGFEGKPESEREDILIYLFANWQDLQVDPSLVEALKETKFVRNADEFCNDLSKPKDLLDPGDSLLTSVFSGERRKFPGERFSTDSWLHILRKSGLRTSAEPDVIIECAKRMEFLGSECMKAGDDDFDNSNGGQNEVSVEIWTLAGTLVETVLSNFAVLYGNNFCSVLGKIACIPAEFGFPEVGGRKGGKRVLTSYSDTILSKDWPLAWSCAPILTSKKFVPPEFSWGSLQLRSPPAFSTVLKHLQIIGRNGGEDTLAHWSTASGMITVDKASCAVLKYLDQIQDSLSNSDLSELQKVPFIPAANGTRLVTANLLFARLSINLSPFAFELPALYLPFVKILKDLGLQDTLSIDSAKELLFNLQRASGYQRLNPNELRAVLEILYWICDGSDGPHWSSEAIVPDDGCRLVHAKSCVYIDSYGSRFVKSIETSKIRFIHPDLPERLCVVLGIKKLSDVVIEELVHEEHILSLEQIGSVSLLAIREKLLSRSFQVALWTVVQSLASYIPTLNSLKLETVQLSLETIAEKLQFVKCLHTRFLLLPKSVDITRGGKDSMVPDCIAGFHHQRLYFVSWSKPCILVAQPPAFLSILDVIAIVVSQVLGSPTPLPIGSLFVCPSGTESAIVDSLKLRSDKKEIETSVGRTSLIGKDILPQDTSQVQFHPLRPFYAGEIVAWRFQNGEKLKFGRVPEDVRPSAGQALYRFKVETAPGELQPVLSSQVLSFRSTSMGSEATMMLPCDGLATHDSMPTVDVPESSARPSQSKPGDELQYGRVTAAELVQAVDEMLSAVGIHMDVEKQSLLQKTLGLQEQLKESQTALLLEQEKADVAAKEADTAKAAWICRVCLTAEVDMTIVPCGHVLCKRCSTAVSRCPFCRLQVSRTMRIFRP